MAAETTTAAEMKTYTVIGLVDTTTGEPTLSVAGVVEGEIEMVDKDPGDDETGYRWADSFTASSPGAAEQMACEYVAENL